jgi:hypothetical protein
MMADHRYNWKRFWCPPDGTLPLTDDGYLLDPESGWMSPEGSQVKPFDAIADVPCLGLLGEPGMGKSREMLLQYGALLSRTAVTGEDAVRLDLSDYDTGDLLCKRVFGNPKVMAWRTGTHRLHLFLDSFDEARLSVVTLATLLPSELEGLRAHLHRLSLRIACRSLEWPRVLEDRLRELWGQDFVRTYELAPLRERDVAEAASAKGLDGETFLEQVAGREAGPLAAKPVTLEFLLGIRCRGQGFPATRAELYEQGCRILCEEQNPSRLASQRTGELTAGQRFGVASRLAALTVLSSRAAIWTGPDDGSVPESDLRLNEASGDAEQVAGEVVEVTSAAVKETLNTGLFSSRGDSRMGWAHQSYAEFLAAWYLAHRQMPDHQMKSLIVHPQAPEGKLVPQLYETAAWLASLSPGVLQYVAHADPQVLLRGDITGMAQELKTQLTTAILERFEHEKLMDTDRRLRHGYAKLGHPGLADQLRPYITDREKGWLVRRAAIDIAEACALREMQDHLLGVALDQQDDYGTRVQAAYAIVRIADDSTKDQMRPLAYGESGDDPDDELKGCALRALWPHGLSTAELFRLLTSPKNLHLFGAYESFIHHLAQSLTESDLPVALGWVQQHPDWGLVHPFRRLVDDIVAAAWDHLDSPGILSALAQTVVTSLKQDHCVVTYHGSEAFAEKVRNDPDRRRALVAGMLPLLDESDARTMALTPHGEVEVVTADDLPWLVEKLGTASSDREQLVLSELIARLFMPTDPAQSNLVYIAAKQHAVLWEKVQRWFEPIQLASPEFLKRYREQLELEQYRQERGQRLPEGTDPKELIARFVGELGAGDHNAWWRLIYAMSIGPHSQIEPDLTALPGWPQAVELMGEQRLIQAARTYLFQGDPETQKWLGDNVIYWPALAGYRALRLLMALAPAQIQDLPDEVWGKWAPAIIGYPTTDDVGIHQGVVALAYQAAPQEVISTLRVLIDKENAQHDHIFIVRAMDRCWDERLGQAVLEKVKEPHLKPSCMRDLLAELIRRNTPGARAFAESLLSLPIPAEDDARSRAVAAGAMLMIDADDSGWPVVWPAMEADVEFGRAVVSAIANAFDMRELQSAHRLTDSQLADLYVWVSRQYPQSEDPNIRQPHAVGLREEIARWRASLLVDLKGRGTFSSCAEVGRIARALPEADSLKWHVLEAQEITYQSTWEPPSPAHVLELVRRGEMRLVRNGDELAAVLVESLERLQAKLQDDLAAAIDLWNEKPCPRPKDEGRVCDYIARHLREDLVKRGIVANREVKISPGHTDIHVDALAPRGSRGYGTVSAIIEVKGCWHREVGTAMNTQLVDRYLTGSACSHGLYVVGWFLCPRWDDKDYRKGDVKYALIEAMREDLERQAADLSTGGVYIRTVVLDVSLR